MVGPDGVERELNSKATFTAPAGALIVLRAPGSGGYGPPAERDPGTLRDDVINGYVTAAAARSVYQGPDDLDCPACRGR